MRIPLWKTNKVKITYICLFLLVFLSSCASLTIKKDLTPDETARIAINAVVEETTDLLTQCRQYAAIDPVFKATFKTKLIPIFEEATRTIDTFLMMLAQGQTDKIDANGIRTLLRQVALELAKAKGVK